MTRRQARITSTINRLRYLITRRNDGVMPCTTRNGIRRDIALLRKERKRLG